jgi:hypothetical protein
MSAFLLSAAGPVLAWTNQDQLACEVAQVNCPAEAKSLEPRATAIKSAAKNWDQLACELAQVNWLAEAKNS